MAKKRKLSNVEIADRVKAERRCPKCGKMIWTDRCHRICPACKRVAENNPVPPSALPHGVALMSGGALDALCHVLGSIQEAGYGA